jgi:hypothetical protein
MSTFGASIDQSILFIADAKYKLHNIAHHSLKFRLSLEKVLLMPKGVKGSDSLKVYEGVLNQIRKDLDKARAKTKKVRNEKEREIDKLMKE